jgi:hypothetical protein
MKPPSQLTRLACLAAAIPLGTLGCGHGHPVLRPSPATWVGIDTGLLNCDESRVASLDDAISDLEATGVSSLRAAQGTPLQVSACPDCSCTALVYSFVAIDDADAEQAREAGFTVFERKDIAFF